MSSPAFDLVCDTLERVSPLSRLQARGTVRLALREVGLEPHSVSPEQLVIVIERVLGKALRSRGISDDDRVCGRLKEKLLEKAATLGARYDSPEEIVRRFSRN
jgi:hypothetical protein